MTDRQLQILSLTLDDKNPKEIAWELGLEVHDIWYHSLKIRRQFRCNSLLGVALKLGLLKRTMNTPMDGK